MLLKPNFALLILAISLDQVSARLRWLERDGRAVNLYPRRFGQEQPAVIAKLGSLCPGQVCGTLAGQAITPLLAAQPECSQQDMADAIIDASKQFDAATAAAMVAAAIEYRQAEKNTPPDFTANPPIARNSVFCQKAPKNPELNGLVQAQDPANDPNIFFDPALKQSVTKGSQPNTFPFGGAAGNGQGNTGAPQENEEVDVETPAASGSACVTEITVTVTGTATATGPAVTVSVGDVATTAAPAATAPATPPAGVDFGSCSTPEVEFGVGFDNRRETSFQPSDLKSFNHGSAQNINIITQFICDTLTNSCKANQAAKDLCAQAATAASNAAAKTGAQADAFNKVFGITTNFATVAPVDDQGRTSSAANLGPNTLVATPTTSSAAAATTTPATENGNNLIGNFGSCTVPQIEFAAGFDNRKETSFQPVDKASYNHGSAQNIDIITQFICDTLTNTCKADATAKATCQTARAAASAAAKGTGAQADAFNKAFGLSTNFASVTQIDNQGNAVGVAAAPAQNTGNQNTGNQNAGNQNAGNSSNQNNNGNGSGAVAAGNLQSFTGALGGVTAPAVTALGGGQFQVAGNSAFNNQKNALVRSCDVQSNKCSDAANASGNKNGLTVSACSAQAVQCRAAAN
ncbi:hypothetical protein D9613_007807 [Agrocybe pediades]|uniref:Uncharacterized protein n=1 Tax=Agrocybe pediades TaxID=84607 RepID=A0A8H4QM89_9AGAR|nr:hypothetical protein D9613_007807 [Agrocybe pediades]